MTLAQSPLGTGQHLPLPPSGAHTRLGLLVYLRAVLGLVTGTGAVATTIFNYLALASACPQLHAAFAMRRSAKTLAMCSFPPTQAQARCPQPQ